MPRPSPQSLPRTVARAAVLLSLALAAGLAAAGGKAHEHGALTLDVAIDGPVLSLALEVPLDNLLGFERAPRTDAERKAAAEVLARWRAPAQGRPLFAADAAAQCTLARAEVEAAVLEPGGAAAGGHADLEARYEFRCARPAELRRLDLGLFEAYPRMQRIAVQVVGPQGQSRHTLRRPVSQVPLAR